MSRPVIALLTDFGLHDVYVGIVKAVLLDNAPEAHILDLTHAVPPQDLWSGTYQLATALPYVPEGAVVMAVVDPGVGTARRPIALRTARHVLVAPDNGLLTLALSREPALEAVALTDERYHRTPVSATFHGRDIFAPVAAHLARGVALAELGTPVDVTTLCRLELPQPAVSADRLVAAVVHIDRYGNLVTNLTGQSLWQWQVGRSIDTVKGGIPLGNTFGDVAIGAPVAYVGSSGHLEIAVRNGSAALRFGARQGSAVILDLSERGIRIRVEEYPDGAIRRD